MFKKGKNSLNERATGFESNTFSTFNTPHTTENKSPVKKRAYAKKALGEGSSGDWLELLTPPLPGSTGKISLNFPPETLDKLRDFRTMHFMPTVIETPTFQKQADKLWSADERLEFISLIAENPIEGSVISRADGARKVRWSRSGSGKSSGARIIYFNLAQLEVVLLVTVYAKAYRENMLPSEIKKAV